MQSRDLAVSRRPNRQQRRAAARGLTTRCARPRPTCGDPRFWPGHSRRSATLESQLSLVESDGFYREHYGDRYDEAVDVLRSDLAAAVRHAISPRPAGLTKPRQVPRARGAGRPRGRRTVRSAARSGSSGDDGSGLAGGGDPAHRSPTLDLRAGR